MHYRIKGFTVLELLISIVIIGILGSILTASYLYFVDKARYANNRQLIRQLVQTITCVQNDNRKYSLSEMDKEAMFTFYEFYHETTLDEGRLHDVGMNADGNLIIIVTFQDLFTVYNYHLNEYFHTRDSGALEGLIIKKTEPLVGRLIDGIVMLDPIKVLGIPTIPMGTQEFYLYRYESDDFTCDIYFRKGMIEEAISLYDNLRTREEFFSDFSSAITSNTVNVLKEDMVKSPFMVYRGYKNNLSNDTMFAFGTNELIGSYDRSSYHYDFILRIN